MRRRLVGPPRRVLDAQEVLCTEDVSCLLGPHLNRVTQDVCVHIHDDLHQRFHDTAARWGEL
jgi:hypothetical protein